MTQTEVGPLFSPPKQGVRCSWSQSSVSLRLLPESWVCGKTCKLPTKKCPEPRFLLSRLRHTSRLVKPTNHEDVNALFSVDSA